VGEAAVRAVLPTTASATRGEGAGLPAELPDREGLDVKLSEALDAYERVLIVRALSAAGGVVAEAARRLQTDRPNLYRRMKRLGIAEP
jgi:two-component system nitrogen regulation response regulator NtrX